jgi:hypothetical protein
MHDVGPGLIVHLSRAAKERLTYQGDGLMPYVDSRGMLNPVSLDATPAHREAEHRVDLV